jgi:hypothetical protein
MNLNDIINKLYDKQNGSFFKVRYVSELPLTAEAKRKGVDVYKITEATVRKGVRYSNMKAIKAKVEAGYVLTHKLPWGTWHPLYEGLIIQHKDVDYIQLATSPNKSKSIYVLNGETVSYAHLKKTGYIQNSWFTKMETMDKPDVLTIKVSNIMKIF